METELEPAEPQWLSREYPVTITLQRRTSKFCLLTEAEIEIYANLGWATNILLVLFGVSAGFALGCVAALMQGNLPVSSQVLLTSSAILSGIPAILFFLLAVASLLFQRKVKRMWEAILPTTANPDHPISAIDDRNPQAVR